MKKLFFSLIISSILQIVIPVLYYFYLDNLLDYEYANGIRTSTNGDTITLPVVGMFILVFFALFVINIGFACYLFLTNKKVFAE